MKAFLKELKKDWIPLSYGYRHNLWEVKHLAKKYIQVFNRELVVLLLNLKSNTLFCVTILLLLAVSSATVAFSSTSNISDFLETILTVIIGFVSVIVAGAVFITSQSNSSALREHERQTALIKSLNKQTTDIFRQALHQFGQHLELDQQWSLIRAHAAASVLDQGSYEKFADWLMSINNGFEGSSYDADSKHPYTLARAATEGRTYSIEEGIRVLDSIRNRLTDGERMILDSWTTIISNLKVAIVGSASFNFISSYSHGNFLGARLGRVIFAGLAALFLVIMHKAFSDSEFNLIKGRDFNTIEILNFAAVFICISALVLSLRYIVKFVALLRTDSESAPTSPVYFYARNPSEVLDQASYYAHGR